MIYSTGKRKAQRQDLRRPGNWRCLPIKRKANVVNSDFKELLRIFNASKVKYLIVVKQIEINSASIGSLIFKLI